MADGQGRGELGSWALEVAAAQDEAQFWDVGIHLCLLHSLLLHCLQTHGAPAATPLGRCPSSHPQAVPQTCWDLLEAPRAGTEGGGTFMKLLVGSYFRMRVTCL